MEGQTMDAAVDSSNTKDGHRIISKSDMEWETARGAKLQLIRTNPFGFLKFQWVGSGSLPDTLKGNYTNERDAKAAADKYIKEKVEDQTRGVESISPDKVKRKSNAKKPKSQSL